MKTVFKSSLAIGICLTALPLAAQDAQQKVLVAQCEAGQGCTCAMGATTVEETAVLLGVETPPAGFVLLNTSDGMSFDPRGLDGLHEAYGGGGVCEIDLFAQEQDTAADASDGIVPRDGVWAAQVRDARFSQCKPMIETMLRSSGALEQMAESRRISWGGQFDPNAMNAFNEDGQQAQWRPAGPNSWTGQIFDEAACDGDACSGVSVDANMTIISPTHIESGTVLGIPSMIPDAGGMAEMAALGLANCEVTMLFDLRHQAD